MERFEYEGEIVLGCQEGGFAAPEIELVAIEGNNPQGVTQNVRAMTSGSHPKTLDEILRDQFGPTKRLNDFGDESVGKLRLIVERVA